MAKPKANRRLSGRERQKRGESAAEPHRPKGPPRTGMARDIAAVLLLALGAASGLALTTFSSLDGALIARRLPPANLIGPLGHRAASALYRLLGFAALVVPVGLVTVGWRLLRGGDGGG